MQRPICPSGALSSFILLLLLPSYAQCLTVLSEPGQFSSPIVVTNDFENFSDINLWPMSFDSAKAWPAYAEHSASDETPSGIFGVSMQWYFEPMRIDFALDVFEVGTFFGNDDYGLTFDVELALFDNADQPIGSAVVVSNANDFADQFIGLRSDVPIRSVQFRYSRPAAGELALYIDDFIVGLKVPEPSTLLLAIACACNLSIRRRPR